MDRLKLTDQQSEILKLLYRFRFLTSTQLQKLLNEKTLRLTNHHLHILSSGQYIDRHYSRKLGEGNQPAVYFLAPGSIKAIDSDAKISKRIYREKIRSSQFIDHALLIANYYLYLASESLKSNHKLHFYTKTDLLAHPYLIHPLPDAYFARIDLQGETKRYFLEVIDEGSPRFALKKRINQYNSYLESGEFETATGHPFPKILFICPTVGIKIYLQKHLLKISDDLLLDTNSIYLATTQEAFAGMWEKITY